MKSIVMCCIVMICATIVHGEDYDENDEEFELSILKEKVGRFISDYNNIINQTELIIASQVSLTRTEGITKPAVKTLDQIRLQTVAAAKGGANKTHCYEAAKLSATTAAKHASDGVSVCGEEYKKIIKANVTEQTELLKTLYTKLSSSENGIDQTLTDKLTTLETQYIKIMKNILNVTSSGSLRSSPRFNSCLGKLISSLTADLQNVQSHASACISDP